jgi:endonuclease/exonuclease/phosphatase family metal-dependent hydrolase
MTSIKILTWNINQSGSSNQEKKKIDTIYEIDADIVCLQEANDTCVKQFNDKYEQLFSVETHCGNTTMLRRRNGLLGNIKVTVFSEFMTGGVATFQMGKDSFSIATCHLTPYRDNQPVREHQLVNVLQPRCSEKSVICGDTNIPSELYVESKKFNFQECESGVTWCEGFFADAKDPTRVERFDRVFARGINVTNLRVMEQTLSDHNPIVFLANLGS